MLERRKKDLIMRMLEELMSKLQHLYIESDGDDASKAAALDEASQFFLENFNISDSDEVSVIGEKIGGADLFEQYATMLMYRYQLGVDKDKNQLFKALEIVDYLQKTDTSFSWGRTILREDLLRLLDEKNPNTLF